MDTTIYMTIIRCPCCRKKGILHWLVLRNNHIIDTGANPRILKEKYEQEGVFIQIVN